MRGWRKPARPTRQHTIARSASDEAIQGNVVRPTASGSLRHSPSGRTGVSRHPTARDDGASLTALYSRGNARSYAMQSNGTRPTNATKPRMQPFLPATADFARGKDSPREFLERCIAQLDAWEPKIGAFVTLNLSAARTAADASTERWRGGKPPPAISAGHTSQRAAARAAALREAGAVIVGKTVTTEFAWMHPRATRNPWDLTRTPGGSSSGSAAAVAVGAISVGIGTQVFGSIVRPSSFCGCFGFKPTVGAINRGGSHDALSQSTHGPIAASLPEA